MIDPNEKGVITRTQVVCSGSPKLFSISEEIISNLSAKTVHSLNKLQEYKIPSNVIARLKAKNPFDKMTDRQMNEIVDEFKKFIAILVINREKGLRVEMVSELVDEVWHTFILFTNEYRKFCDTIVGEYIHHEPDVNSGYGIDPLFPYKKKQSIEFFYQEYERYFGLLPQIWHLKESSTVEIESEQIRGMKHLVTILYIMSTVLVPTFLIWQFYENMFFAFAEAWILEVALIIISVIVGVRIKNKIMTSIMFKGSVVVGTILLLLITIFWYICWDNYFPLVYNIFGAVALLAAFNAGEYGKTRTRIGGIGTAGCGSMSGGGGGGGCCGGGGCGGGGCGG